MKKNCMVSIIIPVYNAEKYLEKCLQSLQKQKNRNFEVILVDDGSTDSSLSICKTYSREVDNFHYFHQENSGVSIARNRGIEYSQGDIITFVDADDWVEDFFTDIILNNIDNHDILAFDGYICSEKTCLENHIWKSEKIFKGQEKELLLIQSISYTYPLDYVPKYHGIGTAWGKAYKRNFIIKNGLCFNSDLRMSEDALFTLNAIELALSIRYIDKCLYFYRNDNISACRSYDPAFMETNKKTLNAFYQFIIENNYLSSEIENAWQHRSLNDICLIVCNFIFKSNKLKQRKLLNIARKTESIDVALQNRKKYNFGLRRNIILFLFEKEWFNTLSIENKCEKYFKSLRIKLRKSK